MPLLVAVILLCVSQILTGAVLTKPHGWAVLTLAVIALLLAVLGGFPFGHAH